MSLVTTRKGDVLLEYHSGTILDIPNDEKSLPMPLALILAKHQGQILFVFNRRRGEWELPGGIIEAGEAPHEAAMRELAEESGQYVSAVDYVSWMKFRLTPNNRIELGVLYRCDIDTIQPFEPNDEIVKIMFWDMERRVEGHVNPIDMYIAQRTQ